MHTRRRRRLQIAIVAGGIVLVLLIAVGIFGLARGPSGSPADRHPSPALATEEHSTVRVGHPHPIPSTRHPERFARRIAEALFDWDTRSSSGLSEWAQPLVDVADAEEAAGLASDVRGYLPTVELWDQLSSYGTRQWLVIDSIDRPATWATATEQAAPGQLPPGATAYTVVGTRYREGTWDAQLISSAGEVAFTIFIACPVDEVCRLLRLSGVNERLE
jgi:hypothetical protein